MRYLSAIVASQLLAFRLEPLIDRDIKIVSILQI